MRLFKKKIVIFICSSFLVFSILLLGVFFLLSSPEFFRYVTPSIQKKIQEKYNTKINIGYQSINLLGDIKLRDISAEYKDLKYGKNIKLAIKEISLDYSLGQIIKGKFQLTKLFIKDPIVIANINELDLQTDLSITTQNLKTPEAQSENLKKLLWSSPLTFIVSSVSIENAGVKISYKGEDENLTYQSFQDISISSVFEGKKFQALFETKYLDYKKNFILYENKKNDTTANIKLSWSAKINVLTDLFFNDKKQLNYKVKISTENSKIKDISLATKSKKTQDILLIKELVLLYKNKITNLAYLDNISLTENLSRFLSKQEIRIHSDEVLLNNSNIKLKFKPNFSLQTNLSLQIYPKVKNIDGLWSQFLLFDAININNNSTVYKPFTYQLSSTGEIKNSNLSSEIKNFVHKLELPKTLKEINLMHTAKLNYNKQSNITNFVGELYLDKHKIVSSTSTFNNNKNIFVAENHISVAIKKWFGDYLPSLKGLSIQDFSLDIDSQTHLKHNRVSVLDYLSKFDLNTLNSNTEINLSFLKNSIAPIAIKTSVISENGGIHLNSYFDTIASNKLSKLFPRLLPLKQWGDFAWEGELKTNIKLSDLFHKSSVDLSKYSLQLEHKIKMLKNTSKKFIFDNPIAFKHKLVWEHNKPTLRTTVDIDSILYQGVKIQNFQLLSSIEASISEDQLIDFNFLVNRGRFYLESDNKKSLDLSKFFVGSNSKGILTIGKDLHTYKLKKLTIKNNLLKFYAAGFANTKTKDLNIRGNISVLESKNDIENFNLTGNFNLPWNVKIKSGKFLHIDTSAHFNNFSVSFLDFGLKKLDGNTSLTQDYELIFSKNKFYLKFTPQIIQEAFQRIDFKKVEPYIEDRKAINFEKIYYKRWEIGPGSSNMSINQNLINLSSYSLALFGGDMNGSFYLNFHPQTPRLGLFVD
jgi:hypothetical protein